MPSPTEVRSALLLLTSTATAEVVSLRTVGAPEARRWQLLQAVPALLGYYTDGATALAVDFYDDERAAAGAHGLYEAVPFVDDRTVKIRRAVAWAAEPLFSGEGSTAERLGEVVQDEIARPFRSTITGNRRHDDQCVGWRRVTAGGCGFCRMLADKGAVFRQETANFAAHHHCHCSAQPVFRSNDPGTEVPALAYVASRRRRSPAEQARLRDYIAEHFPD